MTFSLSNYVGNSVEVVSFDATEHEVVVVGQERCQGTFEDQILPMESLQYRELIPQVKWEWFQEFVEFDLPTIGNPLR